MLLPVRRNLLLTIVLAWATCGVARLGPWLSITTLEARVRDVLAHDGTRADDALAFKDAIT